MKPILDQIIRYGIGRLSYAGRYSLIDPTMTGKTRFSLLEGDSEPILKCANYAKMSEYHNIGTTSIKLNTNIRNLSPGSYIQIDNIFYKITQFDYSTYSMEIENGLENNYSEGTLVRLFSVPASMYAENVRTMYCSIIIGNTISVDGTEYTFAGSTQEEANYNAISYFEKNYPCNLSGNNIYIVNVISAYSSSPFVLHTDIPLKAGFAKVNCRYDICNGDELVFFNNEIRAHNRRTVKDITILNKATDITYLVKLDMSLDSYYTYCNLIGNPAYFSKDIEIGNTISGPFSYDMCSGTTFGEKSEVVTGIQLNSTKENAYEWSSKEVVWNVNILPSDLWLSEAIQGKCYLQDNELVMECDSTGLATILIKPNPATSNVAMFTAMFSVSSGSISVYSIQGEVYHTGILTDNTIVFPLNDNVVITIRSFPNDRVRMQSIRYNGNIAAKIKYFILMKTTNSRAEANGIQLRPVFRQWQELAALVDSSTVGEGKLVL